MIKQLANKILLTLTIATFGGLSVNLFANDGIKIYIIHAINSDAEGFWYPWLKSELSSEVGKEIKAENILIPTLPSNATFQIWKDKIKEIVPKINERTYFVTHGVAGVVVLKFIEESGHRIGGIVLVEGFDKPVATAPKSFTSLQMDYKTLAQRIKHISVIAVRDNKDAPYKLSEDLANNLNAKFILEQGGRVKANKVGYTSPQLIYSEIRLMIDTDNPPPPPPEEDKKDKK